MQKIVTTLEECFKNISLLLPCLTLLQTREFHGFEKKFYSRFRLTKINNMHPITA